jgi:hypothetical protein
MHLPCDLDGKVNRGSPSNGLDSGGPAILGPKPFRPETLRRHLSMALPLSESRRNYARQPMIAGVIRLSVRIPAAYVRLFYTTLCDYINTLYINYLSYYSEIMLLINRT